MILILYFVLILLIFSVGYIFSLHFLISYLAPEDLEPIAGRLSGLSRRYLLEVLASHRVAIQLSVVIKSLSIVTASFLATLIAQRVAPLYPISQSIAVIISLVVVWVLYLFFLEYLPRRRAAQPIDRSVLKFLPLFALAYLALRPLLLVYRRLFSFHQKGLTEERKEDLVERAIETLAERSGVSEPIVEEEEREMIGQIFQLNVTEVREIMVPRIDIKGLPKGCRLDDVRRLTDEVGYSRYPIYDQTIDNILGILYIKDLFTELPFPVDEAAFDVAKYMRKPHFIPETKKISVLLSEFKAERVHMAIVVDEYGGTSGLITMEDILEEIVGDIKDEHDYEPAEMTKLPDGSLLIDPGISVEELIEELNLEYETEDFETVGGLIYDLVGSVPTVGSTVGWKGLLLEVAGVEGQRITQVKVRLKRGAETQ
ncbi:conserved membrane hypothetical protein [Candidatus Zixiibacteriota bacterium]|nr:conserved membrane hypothetical protein [candidate division Zixibacteria bacterium]